MSHPTNTVRVFHIISHFDVGGAERVAANIAKSATPGIDYHVVEVIRSRGSYSRVFLDELRRRGIVCHRFIIPQLSFHYVVERIAAWLFPLWFVFVCLRWHPQVLHCHTEIPELATYRFFRLFPWFRRKCRVVRTIHNTRLWTGMERTGRRVERFMRQQANVAISPSVQESYAARYGQQPPIIYNGIEPSAEKLCYGRLHRDKTNILFAGRFEEQKGISALIEIVRLLRDDQRYYFHIIGDGRLSDVLSKALSDCPNAELQPPVFGLQRYLSSFDYLLMPSLHEGLSILSIEASMERLPVIANSCPGLIDTLPPHWPLAVAGNSIGQYARLFNDILPTVGRAALAHQAEAFATSHFGLRQMQQSYERLYLQV